MEQPPQGSSRQWLGVLAPALVCLALGALGGIGVALVTKPAAAQSARFTPPRERPPEFRLRDEDGHWRTLTQARGNVLVLTFLYSTCRDLCPRQAAEIKDAVLKAGDGVEVYGISVDPVGDTPERVRTWLKRFGLYGGPVHFLIGTRAELAPVWAEFGIVPIDATPAEAAAAATAYDRLHSGSAGDDEHGAEHEEYEHAAEDEQIRRAPPAAALDPYPDSTDSRYRGRPRHKAGIDFEHSAYVMLIDKHGRQRVGFTYELLDSGLLLPDLKALRAES